MKRNYFFLFLLFPCLVIAQQPSQADLDKLQKEMQQKVNAIKSDPKYKQYFDKNNAGNATSMMNTSSNPFSVQKPDTAFLSKIKIPDRNNKALQSLPAKTYTKTELIAFIRDIKNKIATAMGGNSFTVKETDVNVLSNDAVLGWYAGAQDRALVLALDAAEKNPDNDNALNNLSGILTMCGFPYKAVPVLEYVNNQEPDNSTVTNNLGQAYLMMGDAQKAKEYLTKAIGSLQNHPQANFTMACIEYANGNKSRAQSYCESSLRGAYINDAWIMLKAIHPNAKLMDLIRHRYKQPDFFNPHKYQLPEQCKTTDQLKQKKTEIGMFRNMLSAVKDNYANKMKAEKDFVKKNLANDVMKKVQNKNSPFRPFGAFALAVLGDIYEDYSDKIEKLNRYDSTYKQRLDALNKNYEDEKKQVIASFEDRADKAGEGNADTQLEADRCKAQNELANKYLPQFAQLNEERQREWIEQTKNYFNDKSFWCYIASLDDHSYRDVFYQLVIEYITMLEKICTTRLIGCSKVYDTNDKDKAFEFEEGKCPFESKINVETKNEEGEKETPAKFEIDCEKFATELDLGEGVSLNGKITPGGNTTLAFTGGLSKKGKIANILPVSVSGSMETNVTFGNGQPLDIGYKWDYGLNLPGFLGGKNTAGWSVSMNNGVEFHGDGKLVNYVSNWASKNIFGLDPPTQLNKNIKLYNH